VDLTNNIRNHFERNRVTAPSGSSHPGPQVTTPSFQDFCAVINRHGYGHGNSLRSNHATAAAAAVALRRAQGDSSAAAAVAEEARRAHRQEQQHQEEKEEREYQLEESYAPSPIEIGSYLEDENTPASAAAQEENSCATPRSLHDFSYGAFREYNSSLSSSFYEELSSSPSASSPSFSLTSTSVDPGDDDNDHDEFDFSEEQQLMFISSKILSSYSQSFVVRIFTEPSLSSVQ
jgi:hypothetical protein